MRHVSAISRMPAPASTTPGVCNSVTSDFQARLCFLFQLLVQFFLPLAQLKKPATTGGTGTGT